MKIFSFLLGILFLSVGTLVMSAEKKSEPAKKAKQNIKVLFIGNSYTYVNNVPLAVEKIAKRRGYFLTWESVAPGGFSLERHVYVHEEANKGGIRNVKEKDAIEKIREGGWDYVVLQDQSGTPSCQPESTMRGARALDSEIKAIGAQTIFYMTPAHYIPVEKPKNGKGDTAEGKKQKAMWSEEQDLLNNGYNRAAKALGARVAPVGEAFRNNYLENYTRAIHSPDNSHFNTAGSYLAAVIIYCTITGDKAKGLPDPTYRLNPMMMKTMQRIADKTLKDYGTQPHDPVKIASEEANKKYFDEFEKQKAKKQKELQTPAQK